MEDLLFKGNFTNFEVTDSFADVGFVLEHKDSRNSSYFFTSHEDTKILHAWLGKWLAEQDEAKS